MVQAMMDGHQLQPPLPPPELAEEDVAPRTNHPLRGIQAVIDRYEQHPPSQPLELAEQAAKPRTDFSEQTLYALTVPDAPLWRVRTHVGCSF